MRSLGISPMCRVMDELRERSIPIEKMDALEPFGRMGDWHTMDYADKVASLTVWEIDPQMEPALRKNLPNADRKITDAYKEILATDKKFDLIVVDSPVLPHGDGCCEHFDFFPLVFRVARDPFVLILSVAPEGDRMTRNLFPAFFGPAHLEARRRFYRCRDPESVTSIELAEAYHRHTSAQGRKVLWWFMRPRDRVTTYFVMKIGHEGASA